MIPLAVSELAGELPLTRGDAGRLVERVTTDSREAGPGALYCALEGTRVDGHAFLGDVIAAGAAAVICRRGAAPPSGDVAVIEVDDPLTALGVLARHVRRAWGGKVIGVAGSNGKTSTKDILAALCGAHVPTLATHANHNNRLGVPLTLFRLEREHAICVCELGTSEIGELADLCAIAEPGIGVLTNIGPEHLEFLTDVEGVAREEGSLIGALAAGADVVLPLDEALLAPYLRSDLRTTTFARHAADVSCTGWEVGEHTVATLSVLGEQVTVTTALRAPHHALNLAAAAAAYARAGLPIAQLGAGGPAIELSPRRGQERPRAGGGVVINDAYNANPASMEASLADLASRAPRRRTVAVLGHMAELGPSSAGWHEHVGRRGRELGIDVVVAVGFHGADTVRGAAGAETHLFADVEEAASALPEILQPGDSVLLKASRSQALWRLEEACA